MSQSFVIFKLLKRIVLFSYIKLTFTLFKCRLHISQLFGSIALRIYLLINYFFRFS